MNGTQLISKGTPDGGSWAQRTCNRCGAWLTADPDAWARRQRSWSYSWTCRVCGDSSEQPSSSPPSYWSAGREEAEPGTFPPWGRWRLDAGLITRVCNGAERLVGADDASLIHGRESLLDHEGHRMTPWDGVIGDAADPTGARHALAYLQHGRSRSQEAGYFADWAETATLITALIYDTVPDLLAIGPTRGPDVRLPEPVDAGPVIGWGAEARFARFTRRPRGAFLDDRIRLGEALLKNVAIIHTADSFSEYDSDLEHIAASARAWVKSVRTEF